MAHMHRLRAPGNVFGGKRETVKTADWHDAGGRHSIVE